MMMLPEILSLRFAQADSPETTHPVAVNSFDKLGRPVFPLFPRIWNSMPKSRWCR